MADASKAQKLKSSKKRYKELLEQKKKKNAAPLSDAETREETPVDSLTSSTHSSVPEQVPAVSQPDNGHSEISTSPLPNYFNYETHHQQPAEFFDNYATNTQPSNAISNYFNNEPRSEFVSQRTDVAIEDPELFPLKNHVISEGEQNSLDLISYLQGESNVVEPAREFKVDSDLEFSEHSKTDLEKRNIELAAQLEAEIIRSQQFQASNIDYRNQISQLQLQLQMKEQQNDFNQSQEINQLKEELQCHVQTFSILVAEKTELTANVNQLETAAKQKSQECEELQARLKTSRSRVADLEREINVQRAERTHNDHHGREQFEQLDKLQSDYKTLVETKEELTQDLSEAREKLRQTSETAAQLQQENQELTGKLSLASIKIQQLTVSDTNAEQIDQLTREKFELQQKVESLSETVDKLSKTVIDQRDEFSSQYHQYAQQLQMQFSSLSARNEELQRDNESLSVQEQHRVKHIGELERQLQNIQSEQISYAAPSNGELEASKELAVSLQMEKIELEERCGKLSDEKSELVKQLEVITESMAQLESLVEQLRGNQPDSVKLLAAMESDKVAASRAVAQNKELKQQLESMNEVFVKLNNDKVELTEKLTLEEKRSKDLFEKLQKTELHLQTLADAIEIKDRELSHLRDSSLVLNKQVLQQDQLADRLRHFEANDHSSHALQHELQEAKLTIVKLTNQMNQTEVAEEATPTNDAEGLHKKLEDLQLRNNELESKLTHIDSNHNDEMNALDKEVAMKHLEDKVKRTMQDIANLTDEKQRLEHLVLQLQSETETIGEYVALYQHQRSLLNQKAFEKDQQLKQLAVDREQIKRKLQKLNELIQKVVFDKSSIGSPEVNAVLEEEIDGGLNEEDTAEQIITLLSEIKSSNLVQPNEKHDVHHCPWCSGQLITV